MTEARLHGTFREVLTSSVTTFNVGVERRWHNVQQQCYGVYAMSNHVTEKVSRNDTYELMTRPEVEALLHMGRSTIYRLMRDGQLPTPIRIGPRAVRWRRAEIEAHLAGCPKATGEAAVA